MFGTDDDLTQMLGREIVNWVSVNAEDSRCDVAALPKTAAGIGVGSTAEAVQKAYANLMAFPVEGGGTILPMLLGENEGTLTFWHEDLEFTASTRLTALYVAMYERPYVSDEFLKLSDWDYPLSAALEDEEEVSRSWSD